MDPTPEIEPPTVVASGLSGLGRVFPPAKALLARRLVATGRAPVAAEFDRQGLRLSPREQ
jgi:hypothetical protein